MPRIFVLIVALAFALVVTLEAEAGRRWCEADPVVKLGGITYDVQAFGDEFVEEHTNGPARFYFYLPVGMSYQLIATDDGFNGYGETVLFFPNSFPAGIPPLVQIYVPGDTTGGIVNVDVNGHIAAELKTLNQYFVITNLPQYAGLGAGSDTSGAYVLGDGLTNASVQWCRPCPGGVAR